MSICDYAFEHVEFIHLCIRCLYILQVFTDWHWYYLCMFIPWRTWFYLFEWLIFEKKHRPGNSPGLKNRGGDLDVNLVTNGWCPWCYTKPDRIVENPNLEFPPNKRQEMLQVWKVFQRNLQNPQLKKSHQVRRNGLLPRDRQQSDHRLWVTFRPKAIFGIAILSVSKVPLLFWWVHWYNNYCRWCCRLTSKRRNI